MLYFIDKAFIIEILSLPYDRADVAEVCVQSLIEEGANFKSIDLSSKEPNAEGAVVTKDWKDFFCKISGSCQY